MTRPPRNPRRAYYADGNEIRPMTLGNMREHGVRSVLAICQDASCGYSASINVDDLPDDLPVPDVALRLRCSACGSRNVKTQPDWKQGGSRSQRIEGPNETARRWFSSVSCGPLDQTHRRLPSCWWW